MGKPVVFTAVGNRLIHAFGFKVIAEGFLPGEKAGDLVTYEQLDDTTQGIIQKTVAAMTIGATEWTDVVHSAGHPAQFVNFKDANGLNVPLQWRVKTGAENTTIQAKSNTSLSNITTSLICYT